MPDSTTFESVVAAPSNGGLSREIELLNKLLESSEAQERLAAIGKGAPSSLDSLTSADEARDLVTSVVH